jgi:hypothetical protein
VQAPPRHAKSSSETGPNFQQIPIPVGYDTVAKYGLILFQQPVKNSRKKWRPASWGGKRKGRR